MAMLSGRVDGKQLGDDLLIVKGQPERARRILIPHVCTSVQSVVSFLMEISAGLRVLNEEARDQFAKLHR